MSVPEWSAVEMLMQKKKNSLEKLQENMQLNAGYQSNFENFCEKLYNKAGL